MSLRPLSSSNTARCLAHTGVLLVIVGCPVADPASKNTSDVAARRAPDVPADTTAGPSDPFDLFLPGSSSVLPESRGGPLSLENTRIVPNPNNVLSCFVEWTTETPASSMVDFGPGEDLLFRTGSSAPTTAHRVLVIGLYTGVSWTLRATSVAPNGQLGSTSGLSWSSASPPSEVRPASLTHHDPKGAFEGWTLSQIGTGFPWDSAPTASVMYDMAARVVWYSVHPMGPIGVASLVNDGSAVLAAVGSEPREVDLAGQVLWTSPKEPPGKYTWFDMQDGTWHHSFAKLPNGNYTVLRTRKHGTVSADVLTEMDPDGNDVWTLDAQTVFSASNKPKFGNALGIDLTGDTALYASRTLHSLTLVDRRSGGIEWGFGTNGTLMLDGLLPDADFPELHDPQLIGSDRILAFENGTETALDTHAQELTIDRATGTARRTWRFPPEGKGDGWYCQGGGSVQVLPNGNVLLAGNDGSVGAANQTARFMEGAADGKVVWQIMLQPGTLLYRASRFPPPGIVALSPRAAQ